MMLIGDCQNLMLNLKCFEHASLLLSYTVFNSSLLFARKLTLLNIWPSRCLRHSGIKRFR